jgi:putative transposase
VQADVLSLSRSSLYYHPRAASLEEVARKHRIDVLYTRYPFQGSRRITAQMRRDGLTVNRKTGQRHMREMGIAGISHGPNLSRRDSEHRIYPYLPRDITGAFPDHVWGIDVTYVRLQAGWRYLVAVLDCFSRYVVSWELDQTLALPFVLAAVERAVSLATPVIWNSVQDSHFTSPQYLDLLTATGVQISMDGTGRALDNVFVERLWRTVRYEEACLHDFASPREACQGHGKYFMFYNEVRPHQALEYRTPAETYFAPVAR